MGMINSQFINNISNESSTMEWPRSRSHLLPSLADGRTYRRNYMPGDEKFPKTTNSQPVYESVCQELLPHSNEPSFNLETNIIDGYYAYTANLLKKEFYELRQGEQFDIAIMLQNNTKFFNKIAFVQSPNNTIINENLFILTRNQIENRTSAFYRQDARLYQQMVRCFDIGLQHQDPRHWGNRMNTTIIYRVNPQNVAELQIMNSRQWIQQEKHNSQFNTMPDDMFLNHQEYIAVFLNSSIFKRNDSKWKMYLPMLRTGFSTDLSNNSTVSYHHKYSHEIFAGGYQTLSYGPLFVKNNSITYNHDLLNSFSLNYRSSDPLNKLIRTILNPANHHMPIDMANTPNHQTWCGSYNYLMERFYSTIKSVDFACWTGFQANHENGVLPLMQKLPLLRGSHTNMFPNGDKTILETFTSCTTHIDTVFRFARDPGKHVYIYLILIEQGEQCPFINMGNFFKEFTIAPGTVLNRIGSFTNKQLKWRGNITNTSGEDIEYVLVRPAIGDFVPFMTYLTNVADHWGQYLNSRTCRHDSQNVFNENNPDIVTGINQLIDLLKTRIPNNIQIGGETIKKNYSNKKNVMTDIMVPVKNTIFDVKNTPMKLKFAFKDKSPVPKSSIPKFSTKLKKQMEYEENSHFNSESFKSFKTIEELQKYVAKTNKGFVETIKNLENEKNNLKEDKDLLKKSNSKGFKKNNVVSDIKNSTKNSKNKYLSLKNIKIETQEKYVFNKETMRILNLRKF